VARLKVIWTNKSKEQLKAIYKYYKVVSPQGAKNIKDAILKAGRELVFAEQYQQDEIELEFRRVIVSHYKLIYTIEEDIIWILRIFDCRKDPNIQVIEE
jgi:plasmid stabilization system protein ParE